MAMKRFFSEEPEDDGPAKKQVFDKGKARSVSTPVVSQAPLTPGKSAKASRSTSLQVTQTSKKNHIVSTPLSGHRNAMF
ncbi:hypothetical protein HDV62DRAFT_392638 [Trichoderma sp. SZMC 28011]